MRNALHRCSAVLRLLVLPVALACALPVCSAVAALRTASSSGNWSDPAIWSGGIPTAADSAVITGDATVTVDFDGAVCANLHIGESVGGNGTLVISSTNARLDVSGNITLGNGIAAGAVTMTGGTLGIAGSCVTVNGQLDLTGGTFEYNGPGAQAIAVTTYANLNLTGGNKTAGGSLTVAGSLIIYPSATFTSGNFTHHIGGDWWNLGRFVPGNGRISFDGTSGQTLNGHSTFANMTINNPHDVVMAPGSADTISAELTFAAGNVILGTSDLVMGLFASTTGPAAGRCVVTNGSGRLRHRILGGTGGGSFLFPVGATTTSCNALTVALQPSLTEPTDDFSVGVRALDGGSPGFGTIDTSRVAWRVWTIAEASPGGNHINLTFQWSEDEDGSQIGISRGVPVAATTYMYNADSARYLQAGGLVGPPPGGNTIVASTSGYPLADFSSGPLIVGSQEISTAVTEGGEAPHDFALQQNYPNPFNPSTEIRFSVAQTGNATLDLFDLLGQRVAVLFDGPAEAGTEYHVRLDAQGLAAGMYLYRLQAGSLVQVRKMMLTK